MPIPPNLPPEPPDSALRQLFARARTIAIVGLSPDPAKASHYVPAFLQAHGYRIIPVHPAHAGTRILGEPVVASLADLPAGVDAKVDMVEIFRATPANGPLVIEAAKRGIPALWLPLGVRNDDAAAQARALGALVIQDRCPMIELPRLFPDGMPRRA